MDFAVPAGHIVKLKVNEKKDKSLDLAKELKKPLNMKVTIIPIVIGTFWRSLERIIKGTGRFGN